MIFIYQSVPVYLSFTLALLCQLCIIFILFFSTYKYSSFLFFSFSIFFNFIFYSSIFRHDALICSILLFSSLVLKMGKLLFLMWCNPNCGVNTNFISYSFNLPSLNCYCFCFVLTFCSFLLLSIIKFRFSYIYKSSLSVSLFY